MTLEGNATITGGQPNSCRAPPCCLKGGIMLRQSTANNSAFGYVVCHSHASDYGFYSRAGTGSSVVAGAGTHSSLPLWFKLVRSGSNVTACQASNSSPGVQPWHQVGSAQIALSGTIYAGLAVYSSGTNSLCTVNFDGFATRTFNVTVTVPPIAPAEKNAPGIAKLTATWFFFAKNFDDEVHAE